MTKIAVKEAKERLEELLEEAAKGEEVVITGEGGIAVLLVPKLQLKKKRSGYGSAKGEVRMSEDFDEPLEDLKDYMS